MFTDPRLRRRVKHLRSGFTLIELVIGLAAMAFLAATMFGIIQGSVRAASEIEMIQKENRQIKRFVDLCRELFSTFPVDATAELKIIETDPLVQELILRKVDQAFVWGEEPTNPTTTMTLSPRARDEAANDESEAPFFVGLTRPDFFKEALEGASDEANTEEVMGDTTDASMGVIATAAVMDEEGRYWMKLLPKVHSLSWRFYNAKDKRWEDKYDPTRPPLVEMTYTPHSRRSPVRVVFPVR